MIRQHLQPLVRGVLGLVVMFGFLGNLPARAQDAPQPVALEVIARINDYRVSRGRNPLVPDARLEALSRDQARYVLSLPDIPDGDAIHMDAQGRSPREQALQPPYHWETYGSDVQIAIGQNAAVGNLGYAMNFWMNSSIHNRAMLNPVYREIGVWAESYGSGYLFMVTFGARPDELPVTADPLDNLLYLSNEYNTRGTGDWLRQAKTIRLLDASGAALTAAIPWQGTLAIPAHSGNRLSVVFDDGTRQVTREVDLERDIVILPDTLALVEEAGLEAGTVQDTSTPAAAAPAPTPIPLIIVPTSPPAAPDLLIIYDSRSLTVFNGTDLRLDISQIGLSGSGKSLLATGWAKVAPVELDRFSPGGCLQVWSWNETSDPATPSACSYLLSYITVPPADLLWTSAEFSVYQGSTLLATCPAGSGVCEVALLR